MWHLDKINRWIYITCILLVLAAGFLRFIDNPASPWFYRSHLAPLEGISYISFFAVTVIFAINYRRKVAQPRPKKLITLAASMLCVWLIIAMTEDVAFKQASLPNRLMWYAYYVPLVVIAHCTFLSAVYIGMPMDKHLPKGFLYPLIGFSVVLCLLVMTNDYHELAFTFPNGASNYVYMEYGYGPLYFVTMGFILLLLLLSLIILMYKSTIMGVKRSILIALIPYILGVLYGAGYVFRSPVVFAWDMFYEFPETFSILYLFALELMLRGGLMPANFNQPEYFEVLTMPASIADLDGEEVFRSKGGARISKTNRQLLKKGSMMITPDHRLNAGALPGGTFYWIDNLTTVHLLERQLRDSSSRLKEEQVLIQAENELNEREMKINEQIRLYGKLAAGVDPQSVRIQSLLDRMPRDKAGFDRSLKEACVLKAYIKRYCNLSILSEDTNRLSTYELESSLRESVDYLKLYGISCFLQSTAEGDMPAEPVLFSYRLFESVVELTYLNDLLPAAKEAPASFLINLNASEKGLRLNLNAQLPKALLAPFDDQLDPRLNAVLETMSNEAVRLSGSLDYSTESEEDGLILYVSLLLPGKEAA